MRMIHWLKKHVDPPAVIVGFDIACQWLKYMQHNACIVHMLSYINRIQDPLAIQIELQVLTIVKIQ